MHRKRSRRLCRATTCRASNISPQLKPPRYWQWTSDRDLREMGSSYGTIVKVQFKEERRTGKSLGCATSPSAADKSVSAPLSDPKNNSPCPRSSCGRAALVTFEAVRAARDAKEHIESR